MTILTVMMINREIAAADNDVRTEAKARVSEISGKATMGGPQTVTKQGCEAVVSVGAEERAHNTRRSGNLADFLATSPLRNSSLEIDRSKDCLRDVDL